MQSLPCISHSPHPHKACLSLATAYTYAMLVSGIVLLILPTDRCICQEHSSGSLQVKIIYYNIIGHLLLFIDEATIVLFNLWCRRFCRQSLYYQETIQKQKLNYKRAVTFNQIKAFVESGRKSVSPS